MNGTSVAAIVIALGAVAPIHAQTNKSLFDSTQTELIRTVPDLSSVEFDSNQTALDPLLRGTGQQLKTMFAQFVNVSIAEEVHEMRFNPAQAAWTDQRNQFRYVAQVTPFLEVRKPVTQNTILAGRFIEMLNVLAPENQQNSRFRYLGRVTENGQRLLVLLFATRDETSEGVVWIDEPSKRIVRVRSYIGKRPQSDSFDSLIRDVRFLPVKFAGLDSTLWLPSSAVVHIKFSKSEVHNVHRFSDYHVDGFESDTDPAQLKEDTGEAASAPVIIEDPFETLLKGVAALQAQKPADAVAPLQEAASQLPERFEPGYYLALALHATHDLAGAESRIRDCLKLSPDFAAAHNELGTLLFARGDVAAAADEFKNAARLQPDDATIRANLAATTKRLEVSNAPVAPPPSPDVTIKVDVRQVLVPVVVSDKEGHHITGLTQADFKVMEDGVEQKISAFSSERSDLSRPATAAPSEAATSAANTQPAPTPLVTRHAYVICIDSLHASFGNFVYVREALKKLFQQEQAGDSQYALLGVGKSTEIVQNTTSDPKKVLEAIDGPAFKKIFLASRKSSAQFDLTNYERTLQEVRSLCDSPDPVSQMECKQRKPMLPFEADKIAEADRLSTIQFLAQLRSVVTQLAAGRGRRALLLLSDGFLLSPGRAPYGLLEGYFPELRSPRGYERMQNEIDSIYQIAAKGNVPIYTIDSRGLYTSPSFDASRGGVSASAAPNVDRALNDIATEEGFTLSEIAATTGGTAFHNSNDLFAGLQRAFADGREYYLLAYVPSNSTQDGKFRKIEVQVRDKKAHITAKRGYWATAQ